jgi:hypothetical protein
MAHHETNPGQFPPNFMGQLRAWGLLMWRRMRPNVATLTRPERSEDDRPATAVSTREQFAASGGRYTRQQDTRSSVSVDSLLRANAALVHEIE